MFDIAWSELLLIAVVALIFIGPKELPQVLHSLGRMTAKLRRTADDFRRQFEDSVREAGYEDLHKNLQDFRSLNPANQLKDSIARAINQDLTPKPAAPAAPAALPESEPKLEQDGRTSASAEANPSGSALPKPEDAGPAAVSGTSEPHKAASRAEPVKDPIAPAA